MKKTVIAAALATVVAAPAFADTSIGGQTEMWIEDGVQSHETKLVFKASEDLGNGMTASAVIGIDANGTADNHTRSATEGSATGSGSNVVAISGSFGKVAIVGQSDTILDVADKMVSVNPNKNSNSGAGDASNGILYVSPTVSGAHVGVLTDSDMNLLETTLHYANGPLTVQVVDADSDGSLAAFGTNFLASYNMGDLTVSVMDGDSVTDATIAAKYKMGNNTFAVSDGDNGTNASIKHNLSAKTFAYVESGDVGETAVGIQMNF